MKAAALALALALPAGAASAASVSGHTALALAALAGNNDPQLSAAVRAALLHLLDGQPAGAGAKGAAIAVKADALVCHAGNVDIAAFGCYLTYGGAKRTLRGRAAHELYATIAEAGVPGDGAAGTVFEALQGLSCTVSPAAIARKDGSGADCTFEPGSP